MTLIPVAITEAADGDLSEYTNLLKAMYFFDYFDDKKNKKGKYELNGKFEKEIENYRKILAKKAKIQKCRSFNIEWRG